MASTEPDRQPLLQQLSNAVALPPMLTQPGVEKLGSTASVPASAGPAAPTWTAARLDGHNRRRPQCIAHRGFKAKFPENTMSSFEGAVTAGAQALETDVHITKDDVVVLSHDSTLKRCFGRPEKIIDSTWDEIKDLQTIASPHVPMPRLKDLLDYLAKPGLADVWLLLDIKLDNDADAIMRLIGDTVKNAKPSEERPWEQRIVLGIWAAKYLPLAVKYMPGFSVTNIAFSVAYARHFFKVPNVSFNMLFSSLVMPGGSKFLRDARQHKRPVYTWTVNDKEKIEWCIRRQLDGVCTDDVELFLKTCDRFEDGSKEGFLLLPTRQYWNAFKMWFIITVMSFLYKKRFAPVASEELLRTETASS